MIFRQIFDRESSTYTYLLAERSGGEAVIINPVKERADQYVRSLLLPDRVFTGDTLLIRGTGRTDFQNGDAGAQYDSLFGKLLKLPEDTLVYPAHDYNGMTVSSIGEEKRWNPRLQVGSRQEYVDMMNGFSFEPPRMIDIAVPANRHCGLNIAA
jgi:sulfur dioxygenase